ncbi:hypothetical protein WH95_06165 [Kiloniella litopenaei]|uniref:Cache domain-containing protein n=1 Tax=Kiloniella litopenaei TaxID=1549748 RepID=A0A0M2RC30_9PROT|nr:cache domain-containing protein [Kiloniella litopenaei]KKJ77989.1 hypothetical protein WH95_06165 [Kiloniella litopenaei]
MIFRARFKTSILTAFVFVCVQLTYLSSASSNEEAFHKLPLNIKEAGYAKSLKISKWVREHQLLVESFQHAISTAPDPESVRSFLNNIAWDDSYFFSYFGSSNGDMTMFPELALPKGYDPRRRPWYLKTRTAMTTTLSDPYQDAGTEEFVLTLTTPVLKDTEFLGVFGVDINTRPLVSILTSETYTEIDQFFIVNQNGKVLLHPNSKLSNNSLIDIFQTEPLEIQENQAIALNEAIDKTLVFYKIMNLPVSGWYLCAVINNKS